MTTKTTFDGIDFFDADRKLREGVPYDTYAQMRHEAPVSWCETAEGEGFWSVVRYEDCQTVSRDHETYSSAQGVSLRDDTQAVADDGTQLTMLTMDPPKHTRYRLLVNKGFTPRMIGTLKESLELRAKTIVDDVIERGECDFVMAIAAELPTQAIADLMGVPMKDRHDLRDWSSVFTGAEDPEFNISMDHVEKTRKAMWAYANALGAEKRANPTGDIVSALVTAEIQWEGKKQRLTEAEFDALFELLAIAGTETTRNVIGLGMDAFFDRPSLWQQLVDDPSLLDTAAEEMIRWVTPVMYFRRTATRDHELGGERIAAGDKVLIWYTSANRDETIFDDPDTFDITRAQNEHTAFGSGGPHFCLGAALARLEVRVMFAELIRRVPDIHRTGPADIMRATQINGIKHLPVAFEPRKRSTE